MIDQLTGIDDGLDASGNPVGSRARPRQGYTPPTTGPFAPNAPQPVTGAPGTYQFGSPNDPTQYANPQDLLIAQLNQGQQNPQGLVDAANKRFGLQPGSSAAYYANNDTIGLPTGYIAKGSNGQYGWTARGPEPAPTTGSGSPAMDAAMTRLMAMESQQTSQRNALSGQVNDLVSKYSLPVSASDPVIANQVDAFRANQDRTDARTREATAEQAYREGVPSGAFDSQVQNIISAGGQATGAFQSKTISDELNNRRAALSDMLGKSAGILSEGDTAGLQAEIAQIDAQLGQEKINLGNNQLTNQNQQFYDNLALQGSEFGSSLDQTLLALLLGGR